MGRGRFGGNMIKVKELEEVESKNAEKEQGRRIEGETAAGGMLIGIKKRLVGKGGIVEEEELMLSEVN